MSVMACPECGGPMASASPALERIDHDGHIGVVRRHRCAACTHVEVIVDATQRQDGPGFDSRGGLLATANAGQAKRDRSPQTSGSTWGPTPSLPLPRTLVTCPRCGQYMASQGTEIHSGVRRTGKVYRGEVDRFDCAGCGALVLFPTPPKGVVDEDRSGGMSGATGDILGMVPSTEDMDSRHPSFHGTDAHRAHYRSRGECAGCDAEHDEAAASGISGERDP